LAVDDHEATPAALDHAFNRRWLRRFNQILPLPAALLGLWVIMASAQPLATSAAIAGYVLFNVLFSEACVRYPQLERGYARGAGNGLTLFLVAVQAHHTAQPWILGLPVAFAGSFMPGRFDRYVLWGATAAGLLLGSLYSGADWHQLGGPMLVLGTVAFLASRLFEPLKTASIAEHQQRLEIAAHNDTLARALKARQIFLANMSHEIRTPLNGVLGMAELLQDTHMNVEQQEMLKVIHEAGQGLLSTINDVLDVAKLEADRVDIEISSFAAGPLVQRIVDLLKVGEHASQLDIQLHTEGLPAAVKTDPMRLRQVLLNLLGNAIKFTPAGTVEILMAWESGQLSLQVRDTGIGIPSERLDSLFSPFEQADASTARKYGGTGLGLTISQRLVALLGGELWVKSQPGEGSTFGFTIAAPEGTALQETATEDVDFTSTRVLVVDDNPVNLRVAQALLTNMGCETTGVASGPEALCIVAEQSFDVILMDYQMPSMDGAEATRQLRDRGLQTPILALTAGVTPSEQEICHAAGMNAVVAKPVSTHDLRAAFRRWVPTAIGQEPLKRG